MAKRNWPIIFKLQGIISKKGLRTDMIFTDAEVRQDKNAMIGWKYVFPHIPQQTKWNFLGGSSRLCVTSLS